MVPIKISSKLDGLVMKVGGKVKWQKVGFKFKKLRQGETVPLWDEPLPRARPDFPQRNTLFSFKMKLNIWELLKDIARFPLFHPCHHVSSIFSGSGTRFPRRTQCPRRLSPSCSPTSTPSMNSTLRFSRWFCCHCLFHCHRNCHCCCHIFFIIAIAIAIATGIAIIVAIVIAT